MASALVVALVSLHVLGAALWIGGQLVLLPAVRGIRGAVAEGERRRVVRAVARRAEPALWTGFALAAGSGLAMLAATGAPFAVLSRGLFAWKAALVVLAAAGAATHVLASRRSAHPALVGGGAAVGLAASLALLVVGVLLAT